MSSTFDEPGKGRKQCPNCKKYIGIRTAKCPSEGCGHVFSEPTSRRPAQVISNNAHRAMHQVGTPGVGYGGVSGNGNPQPLCPVKPAGQWPHTDEQVVNWIEDVVQAGMANGTVYMPQAIAYMANHCYWPRYRVEVPEGRCPQNVRVQDIIDQEARRIVARYAGVDSPDFQDFQDDAPPLDDEQNEEQTPPVETPKRPSLIEAVKPKEVKCACGQPLHYPNDERRVVIEAKIKAEGEYMKVAFGGVEYRIQRHYAALHGVKPKELAGLAEQGIVEALNRGEKS